MVPQLRILGPLEGGCEQGQQNYVSEMQQGTMLTQTMLTHKEDAKDTVKARPSSPALPANDLGN